MNAVKIIVTGVVQGVGFRYFCYREASEYNICGYAKNLFNGDVEIFAQGEPGLLNDFIKRVKTGPRGSVVKSVHIEQAVPLNDLESFSIY